MFNLIEKLRQKSDRAKKQIAFLVSFIFVGIIFVIWLSVIFPDFKQNQAKEDNVSKLEPGPISNFGDTFSNGIKAIGEEFSKIKESISSFSTQPAYYRASTTEAVSTTTEQ